MISCNQALLPAADLGAVCPDWRNNCSATSSCNAGTFPAPGWGGGDSGARVSKGCYVGICGQRVTAFEAV
jgi:hypothetical protein